jgi:hypothetical protein
MEKIKLKTFTLRTEEDGWLGQIIISSDGMFSSVTDYGNLSYAWRSYGKEDFREFLIRLNTDYFAGKLQNGLSYIAYTKKTMESCDRFSKKILPALQKVLKEDLIMDKDWQAIA